MAQLLTWIGVACALALLTSNQARAQEAVGNRVQDLLRMGRYAEAEADARRRVEVARKVHGEGSVQEARSLDDLVDALLRTGKASKPEAREHCERAMGIKRELRGEKDADYAASMRRLGAILILSGQYEEARLTLQRAESTLVVDGMDPEVAAVRFFRGVLELQAGKPAEAERLFRNTLEILGSSGRDSVRICESLNGLATALYEQGDFAGAIPMYEEALRGWIRAFGPEHPQVATCRHNLGSLYSEIGDDDEAKPQLLEALRVRKKRLGIDHPSVGSTQLALAETLAELGESNAAERYYRQAVANRRGVLGDTSDVTGWAQMKFGRFLLRRGTIEEADGLLRRALAAQEAALGPDHQDLAWTLTGLAHIAADRGERALAEKRFLRAITIQEHAFGMGHPDVGLTLSDYAAFLGGSGEWKGALEASLRAVGIGESHLRLTARDVAERQSLAFASARRYGLDVALDAAARLGSVDPSGPRLAWDGLIRMRTLVLDEVAARQRMLGATRDSMITVAVRDLERARSRLASAIVRGEADAARRERNIVEEMERDLASRSGAIRSALDQPRIGFEEVESALPPDAALVAYVKYDALGTPRYMAFVMRKGASPVAVPLETVPVVDGLVRGWLATVSQPPPHSSRASRRADRESRRIGASLREAVWDPVESYLQGADRAFVVLDGALYGVSFGALPLDSSGYLIEQPLVVHYLSSERDLVRHVGRQHGAGLLALGGADFGGGSRGADRTAASGTRSGTRSSQRDCQDFDRVTFDALPASNTEVREIAALWTHESADVLTGSRATEEEFKRRAPGRRVLHLATHGFFLGAECPAVRSSHRGIGATTSAQKGGYAGSRPGYRQLLRSGLALAGANHRNEGRRGTEDGILTAEEIVSLELSSVDWTVLSACDTGLGDALDGQGVLGLRRAFETAGVGTTILSLWAVDDEATRVWMNSLYEGRLRGGLGTAESVRSASLGVLRARRAQDESTSPFYWAAFVATGDWQ